MSPHIGEWRQGAEIMELGKANSNSRNLYLVQMKEEGTRVGQKPGMAFLVTLSSPISPRHLICSIYKAGVCELCASSWDALPMTSEIARPPSAHSLPHCPISSTHPL